MGVLRHIHALYVISGSVVLRETLGFTSAAAAASVAASHGHAATHSASWRLDVDISALTQAQSVTPAVRTSVKALDKHSGREAPIIVACIMYVNHVADKAGDLAAAASS